MDTNTRLRVATRIHFGLLRHLGDSVEVEDILHRPAQTREVLWVCDASGDDELIALAAQFRQASHEEKPPVSAETVPAPLRSAVPSRDTAWGRDSSGFGESQLPGQRAEGAKPEREWFKPSTWLRTR